MMQTRKPNVDRQNHGQHELIHAHDPRHAFHGEHLFYELLESQLLQHGRHWKQPSIGRQILALEVEWCGSPDFIGPRDVFFSPLPGGLLTVMLFSVVHRLGDSRKSAREVGASRLFCFNAGFSGSPNGCLLQTSKPPLIPVHKATATEPDSKYSSFSRLAPRLA